jgi:hypothetical protein
MRLEAEQMLESTELIKAATSPAKVNPISPVGSSVRTIVE